MTPAASATARLFALQRFGIEPGLATIRALLARLDRPDRAFEVVLVAGTNGKGSTVATLDAMLRAGGVRTGRFTSPHLSTPGERFTIAGVPSSDDDVERTAARLMPHLEATGATFFEAVTALACLRFADEGVTTALFEVGLGGRLDATNALGPIACGITQIALDHQAVLGDTLEAIAREKAGVLRPGRVTWTSAEGAARDVIEAEAARIGAVLKRVDLDFRPRVVARGWDGLDVELERPAAAPLRLRSPLVGRHQGSNVALAAALAGELGMSDDAVARGAAAVVWPGRAETIRVPAGHAGTRRVILDGAHNPAAAGALASLLRDVGERPVLVVGVAGDKDVRGILAALAPRVATAHVTRATLSPRALAPGALAGLAREQGIEVAGVHAEPGRALDAAVRDAVSRGADVPVLVAGSLYLVGEVRAALLGEALPSWERWQ